MRYARLAVFTCLFGLAALHAASAAAAAAELATTPALAGTAAGSAGFDGVVEAVRQTVVAAQVPGAVVEVAVKAGDRVQAGQLLARIDARAADQAVAASNAEVQAARAALEVANKDFQRQQALYKKNYISQAALERAESQYKASRAAVDAQLAQAGQARTQTGFHVVRAPYAGVIAEVPVTLGEMAMPGRALVTLYDPAALRVASPLPQAVAAQLAGGELPRIELPGLASGGAAIVPTRVQVLPTVDAATHTVTLRADLPTGLAGVVPGLFARVWLPQSGGARATVSVPAAAIVRRAEMTGLYVLDAEGRPLLRQVRLGRSEGAQVEILAGVSAGERVVTDPQAAARVR